jgi:hypothetical protein
MNKEQQPNDARQPALRQTNVGCSCGQWMDRNTYPQKGFYKVEVQMCDIPDERKELIDFFDGTYWGYAQFVNKWWSEKVSVLFSEIPQQGFFMLGISWVEQIKLCKFGKYGMGIDAKGTVANEIPPSEEVLPVTL